MDRVSSFSQNRQQGNEWVQNGVKSVDWPCIAKQFVSPLQITYGHASLSGGQNGQFENPKLVFEAL